ncbi:hypothetical protein K469DRAFT_734638 [Zopfia rhizophila CBS 207.26]|uniref:MFS general substrate transporter n=1 Tax=Zopfia rhizophila CBS 207.26 TaxID=1314779 RepID=A0A6A6ERZ4_9PEZI|nr:hypothetical protein K469DRAFT_734638 [Zopfia rhizophila CBS 207.26]
MTQEVTHLRRLPCPGLINRTVDAHVYPDSGSPNDPKIVDFLPDDPLNPRLFPQWKKWLITFLVSLASLATGFSSAAYSGTTISGIFVFVLGFTIGYLLWAPLSGAYGRQALSFGTYAALTIFNAGPGFSKNIKILLVLRFLAGAFGLSTLGSRRVPLCTLVPARYLGSTLGPLVSGFMSQDIGWGLDTGEGSTYVSKFERHHGEKLLLSKYKTALSGPWILFIREPIVSLLSFCTASVYGTLYFTFPGIGDLSFIGVAVGIVIAICLTPIRYGSTRTTLPIGNIRSWYLADRPLDLPWTNSPNIHWSISMILTAVLGFSNATLPLSLFNYFTDAYTNHAEPAIGASAILRSLNSIHGASSIPAGLSVVCAPFPLFIYLYGPVYKRRSESSHNAVEQAAQREIDKAMEPGNEEEN